MNLFFMNIFLNNWLSNDLFSWSINGLYSILCVILSFFNNRIHIYGLILTSVNFNLNIFSLNHWLDICLVINFFSRSCNRLRSCSSLNLCFSCNRIFINSLSLRWNKINFFIIIYNSSFNDWLSNNFFSWCLEIFICLLIIVFGLSSNSWMINYSLLSSLNI